MYTVALALHPLIIMLCTHTFNKVAHVDVDSIFLVYNEYTVTQSLYYTYTYCTRSHICPTP